MTDAQQALGRPLANAFQVLRQGGGLLFGGHQPAVFLPKGFLADQTLPALVAMPGASILDDVGRLAVGAIHWPHLIAFPQSNQYLLSNPRF